MALASRASANAKLKPVTQQLNIRVPAETKELIERAAQLSRQSVTDFTKSVMVERAEAIIARQEQIILSERDYALFVEMMTTDTNPTELALREAAEFKQGSMKGPRYRW